MQLQLSSDSYYRVFQIVHQAKIRKCVVLLHILHLKFTYTQIPLTKNIRPPDFEQGA